MIPLTWKETKDHISNSNRRKICVKCVCILNEITYILHTFQNKRCWCWCRCTHAQIVSTLLFLFLIFRLPTSHMGHEIYEYQIMTFTKKSFAIYNLRNFFYRLVWYTHTHTFMDALTAYPSFLLNKMNLNNLKCV